MLLAAVYSERETGCFKAVRQDGSNAARQAGLNAARRIEFNAVRQAGVMQ